MKHARMTLWAVVFLSAAVTLQAAWTTKRLSNNTGRSEFPRVAVWGLNAYIVWRDLTPGNGEIYFKKSADGGATWQATKRLTNTSSFSESPAIAVSGPNVYVVWSEMVSTDLEIYFKKSTDGGATWEAAQRLTANSGESLHPVVAVIGQNVYVAWKDDSLGNYEIYFKRSTDGGANWEANRKLTDTTGESENPSIAADGSNVYAGWHDLTPGDGEVYIRKSADNGANWQDTQRLTSNSGGSFYPALAVDGSNVYFTWYDLTPGNREIYFKKSTNGGAVWQASKKLTNTTTESRDPDIAVQDSNLHVVWQEDLSDDIEIFYRRSEDNGATWNTAVNFSNNAGGSENPRIAANNSIIMIVWQEELTSGDIEIYVKFRPS